MTIKFSIINEFSQPTLPYSPDHSDQAGSRQTGGQHTGTDAASAGYPHPASIHQPINACTA